MSEIKFRTELLAKTADMLAQHGLQVYISRWGFDKWPSEYFHFTDGKEIGYCQQERMGGLTFSTVHKPNGQCGTGYRITDDPGFYEVPHIDQAKKAFLFAPSWARPSEIRAIVKYKNWDEFAAVRTGPEYLQYKRGTVSIFRK